MSKNIEKSFKSFISKKRFETRNENSDISNGMDKFLSRMKQAKSLKNLAQVGSGVDIYIKDEGDFLIVSFESVKAIEIGVKEKLIKSADDNRITITPNDITKIKRLGKKFNLTIDS